MYSISFFDNKNSNFNSFWQREPYFLLENLLLSQASFYRFSKKEKDYRIKFFKLFEFYLVSFSDQKFKYQKGFIDFHKNYKITVNSPTIIKNEYYFSFSLTKYKISKTFFTNDKKLFDNWLVLLKRFTIQLDFLDKYLLENSLGKGNFAEVQINLFNNKVYKGKNLQNNNYVAVKIIKTNKIDEKQAESIIKEINIMRALLHDNILNLYEVFELENSIAIVCELVSNGDLYEKLRENKNFSEKQAHFIFIQILNGLYYLKQKNIIHRDIKLENILMNIDKNDDILIKIADFGLSENYEGVELIKRCGTPGYIAPEVIDCKPYNEKIDVFSAGVLLYTMINGTPPFKGKNAKDILDKNRNCHIKFKKSVWNETSLSLRKLIKKMLAKDPLRRIPLEDIFMHEWIQKNLSNVHLKYVPVFISVNINGSKNKNPLRKSRSKPKFNISEKLKDSEQSIASIQTANRKTSRNSSFKKELTLSNYKSVKSIFNEVNTASEKSIISSSPSQNSLKKKNEKQLEKHRFSINKTDKQRMSIFTNTEKNIITTPNNELDFLCNFRHFSSSEIIAAEDNNPLENFNKSHISGNTKMIKDLNTKFRKSKTLKCKSGRKDDENEEKLIHSSK